MTDAIPHGTTGEPIDLGLFARPDADAFRHLARALGARYAGDEADGGHAPDAQATETGTAGNVERLPLPYPRSPSGDPRAAEIIDQVPSAVIVSDAGSVVFLNRAAAELLGHTAASLEAAGGIGALVTGAPPRDGAVEVVTADGRVLPARVSLSAIAWAETRAIMITVTPVEPVAGARDTGGSPGALDALTDLLSANPDPVAIISRGGHVEAANAAFEALGGKVGRTLHDRLDAAGLTAVLSTLAQALAARDTPPPPLDIIVDGALWRVTVGALKHADSACLVFRPGPVADGADAPPAPLERACATAQRLVKDADVHVAVAGVPAQELELRFGVETERLFRALLVALAARTPAGTTITVTRNGERYAVELDPPLESVLNEVAMSSRIVLYGLEAGLALAESEEGADGPRLVIAPLLPVDTPPPDEGRRQPSRRP